MFCQFCSHLKKVENCLYGVLITHSPEAEISIFLAQLEYFRAQCVGSMYLRKDLYK